MKEKMLGVASLLVAGVLILSGCNKTENNSGEEPEVGMGNPASIYCEQNGGTLIPAEDEEGNQYAFCQIDEDTICEEWEYYRGDCPVEVVNPDEEINEEVENEEVENEDIENEADNVADNVDVDNNIENVEDGDAVQF